MERYVVEMITQDAEPRPVSRPIAYFDNLAEAVLYMRIYDATDPDCFYAIYDRETETYV